MIIKYFKIYKNLIRLIGKENSKKYNMPKNT